jgi:nucleoside-diphosphate-sugar epimerase
MALTVAVTGPTGEIGKPLIRQLESEEEVERIAGMARRPFDARAHGWTKTEYRQGDITDPDAVEGLVADADVVVHLAFIVLGASDDTRDVNLEGSRNVFRAAFDAGVERLVYLSSVAAYGFHRDNPQPLTEEVPVRGTPAMPYSAQKAELEAVLSEEAAGRQGTDVYVFRPCIVAGPEARALVEAQPYLQAAERLPGPVRRLLAGVPLARPVIPDPGVPFQLVHHDDLARALSAAARGRGEPGAYNVAGPGELTFAELARELGWYAVPVPGLAVDAAIGLVDALPGVPPLARWINAARTPVLMDAQKARRELGWRPEHAARDTLRETVAAARQER